MSQEYVFIPGSIIFGLFKVKSNSVPFQMAAHFSAPFPDGRRHSVSLPALNPSEPY